MQFCNRMMPQVKQQCIISVIKSKNTTYFSIQRANRQSAPKKLFFRSPLVTANNAAPDVYQQEAQQSSNKQFLEERKHMLEITVFKPVCPGCQ